MALDKGLVLLRDLLNSLKSAGLIEFELVPPSNLAFVDVAVVEAALQNFSRNIVDAIGDFSLDRGQVQINAASRDILEGRIQAFLRRKELEREAILTFVEDGQCARTMPFRYRTIGVERVENVVGPQDMEKSLSHGPQGDCRTDLEERLATVEDFVGLRKQQTPPQANNSNASAASSRRTSSENGGEKSAWTCSVCSKSFSPESQTEALKSTDILRRMKLIEDRLLYLESVSPEYSSMIPQAEPLNRV